MNTYKSTSEYKAMARQQLLGKYGMAIAICFLYGTIQLVLSAFSGATTLSTGGGGLLGIICSLLSVIFSAGLSYFFLNIAREKDYNLSDLLYMLTPGKGLINLAALIFGSFLMEIITFTCLMPSIYFFMMFSNNGPLIYLVIGTVFFIVGLTFVARYFLSFYLFSYVVLDTTDRPYSAIYLMVKTYNLMKGHKLRLLYMIFSFVGWLLLGILSFGIGLLWVFPYFQTSMANFYNDISAPVAPTVESSSTIDLYL